MSIKILVADDSITIQKVIGIIFGGDEYSLTIVDNGKSAVDKAREITPDILLIDALMPGMTGYEVAETVRSTPSLASKPILILTGSFEPFDEEKAKKCGADDFIAKPFESQQIINKVKELLDLGNKRALSLGASQQQTAPEKSFEQAPEISAPEYDIQPPVFDKQPEVAPSDIWGAFTSVLEPPVEAAEAPFEIAPPLPPATAIEPDVFAIVSEENDAQLVQTADSQNTSSQPSTSQWNPVEESTFEFEEEVIDESPKTSFAEPSVSNQETSFGDIAFQDEVTDQESTQYFDVPEASFVDFVPPATPFETQPAPAAPFTPLADPTPEFTALVADVPEATAAPSAPLSEEQLKAALAGASKEIIERIVWEVVPDLAEALIREAIRKIKEGV